MDNPLLTNRWWNRHRNPMFSSDPSSLFPIKQRSASEARQVEVEWEDKSKHTVFSMLIPPHLFLSGFHTVYSEHGQKDSHVKTELFVRTVSERLTLLGYVFQLHSYKWLFARGASFLPTPPLYGKNVHVLFGFFLNDIVAKINFSSAFLGRFDWRSKCYPSVLCENPLKTLILKECVWGGESKLGTPDQQDHMKCEH